MVVAARFPAGCEGERDWNGTEVEWPQAGDNVPWRDLFTARIFERQSETVDVCAVLPDLPMAVLVPDNGVRG